MIEDDPLFNAGRGSVFTAAGTQEMDAALMDGRDLRAGAVAGAQPHLGGARGHGALDLRPPRWGGCAFCRDQGIAFAEPDYFYTEERWRALNTELEQGRRGLGEDDDERRPHGTVGAVARDRDGNLAAATSTGV